MTIFYNPLKRLYLEHYQRRLTIRLLVAKEELNAIEERLESTDNRIDVQQDFINQSVRVEALSDEARRVEYQLQELSTAATTA